MSQAKSYTLDPEISNDAPEILQSFDYKNPVVREMHDTDGTIYSCHSNAFALVSRDTTRLGNDDTPNSLTVNPEPATYDRTEYNAGDDDDVKVWVFTCNGTEIAIQYKYIEMVRELTDLTLDQIRRRAKALSEPTELDPSDKVSAPLLVDTDGKYRPVIMPFVGDLDN